MTKKTKQFKTISMTIDLETSLMIEKVKLPNECVSAFIRKAIKSYSNSQSKDQIELKELKNAIEDLNEKIDDLADYSVQNQQAQESRDKDLRDNLNKTMDWIDKKISTRNDHREVNV